VAITKGSIRPGPTSFGVMRSLRKGHQEDTKKKKGAGQEGVRKKRGWPPRGEGKTPLGEKIHTSTSGRPDILGGQGSCPGREGWWKKNLKTKKKKGEREEGGPHPQKRGFKQKRGKKTLCYVRIEDVFKTSRVKGTKLRT